jgi:hypothetical protein
MDDSIVIIEEDTKENKEETKENESHHTHNGKEILKIAVSPKGDYAVTYDSDNFIVGWNITVKKDKDPDSSLLNAKNDVEVDDEMKIEDEKMKVEKKVEDVKIAEDVKMKVEVTINIEYFEIKVSNSDSKIILLNSKYRRYYEIYKLGNTQLIKEYDDKNKISFTLDGKLVRCRNNEIKVYSLNNTNNKLKLESVYKISIDDTFRECGITENKIWARSSDFFYLWDLNSFHLNFSSCLPERSYKITNGKNKNSSIHVLIGDNIIFLNGFNFPIRYIENENLSKKEHDYFLVYDISDEYKQPVKASFYYKTKKIYRVNDDDSKTVNDKKFKKVYGEDKCEQKFMICNLQSNKVYGVDNNNKIITADISNYNWFESDYKDDDENKSDYKNDDENKTGYKDDDEDSGWNNYLNVYDTKNKSDYKDDNQNSGWSNYLNDYDIYDVNDTIIDPNMERIRQLLDKDKTDNSIVDDTCNDKTDNSIVDDDTCKDKTDNSIVDDDTCKDKIEYLIKVDNKVYSWKIIVESKPTFTINIIKGENVIDSKEVTYELIKYILLKNNALALKVKKKVKNEVREIIVIFKFYGNKIQLQYLTYLSNKSVKNENQNEKKFINAVNNDDGLQDVENELPLGDIKSIITNDDDGTLEKEWLEFIITDYFTLLKYGSKYFQFFIKCGREDLIRKTYNKCINLIRRDTKKNFEFLGIMNSSIKILIKEYPDYLNKFNQDMLILLNPTKDKPGKINPKHHVRSDCKIIYCWQLPLWYYYFKEYFFNSLFVLLVIIFCIIIIIIALTAIAVGLPVGFAFILFVILFAIIYSLIKCLHYNKIKPRYYNLIFVPFTLFFTFFTILMIFIGLLSMFALIIPFYLSLMIYLYLKYSKDYDQSIHLTCNYNSLCCYPSEYSWFYELAFKPQSSIFIYMCQRKYYNKKSSGLSKSIRNLFSEIIKFDQTLDEKYDKFIYQVGEVLDIIMSYISLEIITTDRTLLKVPSKENDLDNRREFFNNLNGEAITDFKWRTFGRYYYFLIWLIFIAFQICFIIGSLPLSFNTNEVRTQLYKVTYIIGFMQLYFEFKQFIWSPAEYIYSIWNLFDLSAYLLPTITSYLWIYHNNIPVWLISLSCLFLNVKFLLFFRAFEYFGIYFAIIFGVIRRIFPFLMILIFITISFALSFHLLLIPKDSNPLSNPNPADSNNPWTLSKKYNQISEDGSINSKSIFIEEPDDSTNLFTSFYTSLLATYLFLAGDSSSFTKWSPTADNTLIMFLMTLFSFLIVIYLMNLFIGLLNMSIEKDYDRGSYLVQKAEILAEIELFYLLPFQRRWKHWFPDVINYEVRMDIAQKYVKKLIEDGKWKSNNYVDSEYKDKVLKQLDLL